MSYSDINMHEVLKFMNIATYIESDEDILGHFLFNTEDIEL